MVQDDSDILIDLEDFSRIEVNVVLSNLTSKTSVGSSYRKYGEVSVEEIPENERIRLMEFLPQGVALDVPPKTAAPGHQVEISFDVSGTSLPFVFTARGEVKTVEVLDDGRERFEIEWTETDDRYFNALRGLFSKRQQEIENFINAVKGRE